MSPSSFKRELQRFDKALDFIWNGRKSRWEITGEDRKRRKYLIAFFKLGELEKVGLDYLRDMADVSPTKSSAKEVNRRIDNIIEEEEKQEKKQTKNVIQDRLDEAWERYQYAEGSRVSFALIGNSKNEKVVINDKRRLFKDDSKEKNGYSE